MGSMELENSGIPTHPTTTTLAECIIKEKSLHGELIVVI